jgi:hypothetical protein
MDSMSSKNRLLLALLALGLLGCGESTETRAASLPPLERTLTAWAGPDLTLLAGQSVVVETVFTGDAVRARWDLDGDGREDAVMDLGQAPRLSLTASYPNPGSFRASLRVSDASGQQAQHVRRVVVLASDAPVVTGEFAPYYRYGGGVTPKVPTYSLDPAGAGNLSRFPALTAAERARLKADGFATRASTRDHLYAIYEDVYSRQQAQFISSDSALHAFRLVLTHSLQGIERTVVYGALQRTVDALLARTNWQLSRTADSRLRGLLQRNLAYMGVAARLLGRDYALPAGAQGMVDAEVKLMDAHRGFALSPVFGRKQDYSRYLVRGHYTRSEELKRTYRASLWLSWLFRLEIPSGLAGQSSVWDETLQALLLTQALYTTAAGDRPALAAWDRAQAAAGFIGGRSGQLGPRQMARLLEQVHGNRWRDLGVDALADSARLAQLASLARAQRDPRLTSGFVHGALPSAEALPGMRLLPRPFSPDSYVFQQLVYARVSSAEKKRVLPMGLDVQAALGSARARQVLDRVLGQGAFAGYLAQLDRLKQQLAGLSDADWTQDLRWGWLHALRPLLQPPTGDWPAFMLTPEWQDKELNAALCSWAQQRQDPTLYSGQPLASPGQATVVPVVYVEPRPRLYGRLRSLTDMLRAGLEAREVTDERLLDKLRALEQLFQQLVVVSEDELAGNDPGLLQMDQLRDYGAQLRRLATMVDSSQESPNSGDAPRRGAAVADVYSDPASGQTLQAALGDPLELFVVIPYKGQPYLARGAVNSYHELALAAGDRLTDEGWQRALADGSAPAPPGWIFK